MWASSANNLQKSCLQIDRFWTNTGEKNPDVNTPTTFHSRALVFFTSFLIVEFRISGQNFNVSLAPYYNHFGCVRFHLPHFPPYFSRSSILTIYNLRAKIIYWKAFLSDYKIPCCYYRKKKSNLFHVLELFLYSIFLQCLFDYFHIVKFMCRTEKNKLLFFW